MSKLVPEFKKTVKNNWTTPKPSTNMYQLVGKLDYLTKVLQKLNRTRFSNVEMKAEEAMRQLLACQNTIQQDPHNLTLIEEENKLAQECRRWNKARDLFLQQKSKAQWIQGGDQNIKYIHNYMKSRRNATRVFTIKNAMGETKIEMEEIANNFFGLLYITSCWEHELHKETMSIATWFGNGK